MKKSLILIVISLVLKQQLKFKYSLHPLLTAQSLRSTTLCGGRELILWLSSFFFFAKLQHTIKCAVCFPPFLPAKFHAGFNVLPPPSLSLTLIPPHEIVWCNNTIRTRKMKYGFISYKQFSWAHNTTV